ncbi:MAG: hypothetical protein QJR13_06940, partial [Bacillota bacterium]|nr:hypothetical protein [Bacillota bacterium]
VGEILHELYQGRVATQYVDLNSREGQERYPEVAKLAREGRVEVPVVAIDGQIKLSGYLFVPALVQEIDALLKARAGQGDE